MGESDGHDVGLCHRNLLDDCAAGDSFVVIPKNFHQRVTINEICTRIPSVPRMFKTPRQVRTIKVPVDTNAFRRRSMTVAM